MVRKYSLLTPAFPLRWTPPTHPHTPSTFPVPQQTIQISRISGRPRPTLKACSWVPPLSESPTRTPCFLVQPL